ncbi:MAG: nucleotide-binding universal stress UspA family protein [Gammaproteobacteria bacterium]|jgi:nucleotide-binding universal stress UspA family protein
MSIKDILVYSDNDEHCRNRLLSATRWAEMFGAHLAAFYAKRYVTIPSYAGMSLPVEVYEANDELTLNLCETVGSMVTEVGKSADIDIEFRAVEGALGDNLSIFSRYSDLLIVPRHYSDDRLNENYQLSSVLIGSTCPVLMMANNTRNTLPIKNVLLAWDGGHECARVLRAVLQMFDALEKIDIVAVDSDGVEASDIALHIARHGISTEVHLPASAGENVGARILDQAQVLGSDLVAMGAYGHSRLLELIFGGTCKYVIENAEVPILFSH